MGAVFPSVATIIASSTADVSSLSGFLTLPLIAITFVVTVVIVGTIFFRRWINKGVRGAAGLGGRRGRGRRR